MHFIDAANDLLAIAEKRNQTLGYDISALGDDTWHVLLKLYIDRDTKLVVRRTTLERVMRFPTNLDRILSVLSNRNLMTAEPSETSVGQAFKITEKAVSQIQLILGGELRVTNTML